ncbi:hypothetical protein ACGFX4_40470 [Kitasatospora sp. NPDC048365]|uniref:hypothetical protein n=1 Tax=Kitasatospora sp. NPDC048365 TaxID=3364050 RepID=UPI00371DA119
MTGALLQAVQDAGADDSPFRPEVGVLPVLVGVVRPGRDTRTAEQAGAFDLGRAVRLGVNGAYGVLAALAALAVGSELVIAHPLGRGSTTLALLLLGGPALYLATTA